MAAIKGMHPTLTKKGFDMGRPGYNHDKWVKSYDGKYPLYDIGSGAGTNCLTAISQGARVVAVDMTETLLQAIWDKAPEDFKGFGNLVTKLGELPEVDLPPSSTSGILCAQVIHFLTPTKVNPTFRLFAKWLRPGGLLVLNCASIYQYGLTNPEKVPEMEAIIAKEGPLALRAGWLEDASDFMKTWREDIIIGVDDSTRMVLDHTMPNTYLMSHPDSIRAFTEMAGLEVVELTLRSMKDAGIPVAHNYPPGNEYVNKAQICLVARKPMQ